MSHKCLEGVVVQELWGTGPLLDLMIDGWQPSPVWMKDVQRNGEEFHHDFPQVGVRGCSCAAPGTLTSWALCAPSRTRSAHLEHGRAFAAAKSRAHGARDAPFRNLGHFAQGAMWRAYCALGARPRTSSGTWWSGWMSPVDLKGVPAIVGMLSFLKHIAGGLPKPFINSSLVSEFFQHYESQKETIEIKILTILQHIAGMYQNL